MQDISQDWKGSTRQERRIIQKILKHEGTGKAIKVFAKECQRLDNYWYWFVLSTLWVNYSEWSDLSLWKRLFRSDRPNRETSIMKPSELEAFYRLPDEIYAYRAHRPNEQDWIAYTLHPQKAGMFAAQRGVSEVSEYIIQKRDVLALFLRRGEYEVIVLDRKKPQFQANIPVVKTA